MITQRGVEALQPHPKCVDMKVLNTFEEYRNFRPPEKPNNTSDQDDETTDFPTSEEVLENACQKVRSEVESELLSLLTDSPFDFLERVVVDLIVHTGYGGGRKDAGETLGRSGDAGIEGIIKEDSLGLDIIYLQTIHGGREL